MAYREIVESDDFTKARKALELSAFRLDEILFAVGEVLTTRPTYFAFVRGSRTLRSLRTEAFGETPSYIILFRLEGKRIVLEDIQYAIPDDWRNPLE